MAKGWLRWSIFVFLAVLALIVIAFRYNLLGIRSAFENSAFYERFYGEESINLGEDSRLDKKLYYLSHLLEFPFGGLHLRSEVSFAHDLYLDTYDEASIFAFVAVVAYMVSSLVRMFKCLSRKYLPFEFRQLVFCTYLVLHIEFWIEPILQGMPWLFASFCLIDGAVTRILSSYKNGGHYMSLLSEEDFLCPKSRS